MENSTVPGSETAPKTSSPAEAQSVFLCYAREDQDFVLSLANDLRSRGINVWLDQWSIPQGADWDRSIDQALSSCACLLIVLTPESVGSDEVRGELRTSLDLNKPVVPILLRQCEIPRRLKLKEYVDLTTRRFDAMGGVERIVAAINNATAKDSQGTSVLGRGGSLETLVGKVRRWASARPSAFLAFAAPPIFFAVWQLFRLPIAHDTRPTLVFIATALVCAVALWLGSRAGTILFATLIGTAFVLKPLVVPFIGYSANRPFPYGSATAQAYWLPGVAFLAVAVVVGLISTWSRLTQDFKRLRPGITAALIAIITGIAGYLYFSRPTLYDVYLPYGPKYALLRGHLLTVKNKIDSLTEQLPRTRHLDVPLVIDETDNVRNEDSSTTGHFLPYQNLASPDRDIDYAFDNDLYLHLRDTGNKPVLYESGFGEFATKEDADSLQHALDAPYLVVLQPLELQNSSTNANQATQQDSSTGTYRIFLYQLTRDEIIFASNVGVESDTSRLRENINHILETSVGARILRKPPAE